MTTTFLKTEDGINTFAFVCEGCGAAGNLGIQADDRGPFGCPEGCGALYIQWTDKTKLTPATPQLTCVVCPIFDKGAL